MPSSNRPFRVASFVLTFFAILLAPSLAEAQRGIAFEGRGGLSFPVGRLENLADPGPTGGLQVLFPLGSRFSLGVGGSLEMLEGKKFESVELLDEA